MANAEILWDTSVDQSTDKTWTITFSKNVNHASVDSNSVYVVDGNGNKVKTTVITDDDHVIIAPPIAGYIHSAT